MALKTKIPMSHELLNNVLAGFYKVIFDFSSPAQQNFKLLNWIFLLKGILGVVVDFFPSVLMCCISKNQIFSNSCHDDSTSRVSRQSVSQREVSGVKQEEEDRNV